MIRQVTLRDNIAAAVARFADADNTLVLDHSHERGIDRGLRGQAFAADLLGALHLAEENAPYDLLVHDGTRVDVKTTRWGNPLMVPASQEYKLHPERVDALLLVWDGHRLSLKGQISVATFLERHHYDERIFPVPTMYMEALELDLIPTSWVTPGE